MYLIRTVLRKSHQIEYFAISDIFNFIYEK